ncbi:hypothetical protein ACFSTA_18490 [Ornithinibacillus salinisoli]|uniref:Uncharacterized protein n=1 Tax=Ornithinibacillus salinisoli TaxID=1848459 RepID=A0ABW4W5S8_9BACI
MNSKTLISVIVFLLFALISIIVLDDDKNIDTPASKEVEKENDKLKNKIENLVSVEKENEEIKQQILELKNKNEELQDALTDTNIYTALLNDAKVDGALLKLNTTYVNKNICGNCLHGYELVKIDGEMSSRTITDKVPIYLLDESNTLTEIEWEYLVNLKRIPLIKLFEVGNEILFIREEYHPLRLEGKDIQDQLIRSLVN